VFMWFVNVFVLKKKKKKQEFAYNNIQHENAG
jgi:hypothetical protein